MAEPILMSDEELFQQTGSWEAAAALRDEQNNALNQYNWSQSATSGLNLANDAGAAVTVPATVAGIPNYESVYDVPFLFCERIYTNILIFFHILCIITVQCFYLITFKCHLKNMCDGQLYACITGHIMRRNNDFSIHTSSIERRGTELLRLNAPPCID
jgi:hypothetical protein